MSTIVKKVAYDATTDGAQSGGKFHGGELDRLVLEFMKRSGERSYSAALAIVTKANPTLAKSYADLDTTPSQDSPENTSKSRGDATRHRGDSFDPAYRRRIESRPDAPQSPLTRVPDQAQMRIDRGEAGAEVHRRTMELMRTNQGLNYEGALSAVLQGDPALAAKYRGVGISDTDYTDLYDNASGSCGSRVSGSGNEKG